MAYRGEHVLDLEAKVYAIVAKHAGDPERSNWLGKSALLKSIYFALEGDHPFRTDDEWITYGETFGEVELTFTDGSRVLRTRERARKGAVYFFGPGDAKGAMKDEAQAKIDALIGLSKQDFIHTCYFQQKKMARFIDADPSDRMKIISAWLRLDPLEECEKRAKQLAADLEDADKKAEGHLAALDAREKDLAKAATSGASENPEEGVKVIEATIPQFDELVQQFAGAVASAEDALERNAALLAKRVRATEYETVVSDGKALAAEFQKKKLPVLQQQWELAREAVTAKANDYGAVARDLTQAQSLAKGEFDGRCPMADITCPAKDTINADRATNRARADEILKVAQAKYSELTEAQTVEQRLRSEIQEAERMDERLKGLRVQAKKLATILAEAAEAGEPQDQSVIRDRLDKARDSLMETKLARQKLSGWLDELRKIATTRETLIQQRQANAGALGTHRESIVIFGKKGAQRKVAEGAIATIEENANEVLRASGTDLTVEVRWAREGKGLATSCDACGHPFPTSVKVKNCERCGHPRGPRLESKLDVVLSKASDGAAADLAGAGFQLAASRWLREARGTTWSTALLDEPFGALDAAHRRTFAAHLTAMLSGAYGFEQAFVVAHHASVLDALPGRIEIVSDGAFAVPRVVT